MKFEDKYEIVIGLEVHAQLQTLSKAFSADSTEFGASPNTCVSVITLGHPGTLPKLNEKVVELAVKLGLATNCQIREVNRFARKNYFYADLPKGYQISQFDTPICYDGYITIKDDAGNAKNIRLERIHLEEDAGKSIHDQDPFDSLIDLNRAGVALVEMVSRPDISSSQEAGLYLTEIRKLVRYLDVCDGNMEEGSLRCDANISVRLKGATELGTKVEVKNMNSIRNVQRAIEFEFQRQCNCLETGETIYQETRNFDAVSGETRSMRSKEMAHDYRYFPEPDLPPLIVSEAYIDKIKSELPELPEALFQKFVKQYGLPEYDAYWITEDKATVAYFLQIIKHTEDYKAAANWMMGKIRSYLNEKGLSIEKFPLGGEKIGELIALVKSGKVSNTVASENIFPALLENPIKSAAVLAEEKNLIQQSDESALSAWVDQVIAKFPEKVAEYKGGKVGLIGMFMGEVMKISGGKADPKVTTRLLKEKLDA
ncbi:MAG: Asp-tRNA(Asn)/Glu-tRNA(Gln) amidotransferase subunit GatB [Flavobacteriales bacterium]|nr:Asp-tRNA(Asn)/Glu-tRNA(Gln) amidotransferase subunit GatB [Flavobacteriales bacterium]